MKRLFSIYLVLTMIAFVGCGKEGDDVAPKLLFEIDKESVTISPEGGSIDVVLYANKEWVLYGYSNWCTPSITSGAANVDGQTITFTADISYDTREATFDFCCAGNMIRFTVSQAQTDAYFADGSNTFNVSAGGGTISIPYRANIECELIIPDDAKKWIQHTETRALQSKTAILKVEKNTTNDSRCAVVKMLSKSDKTLLAEYTINQKQNDTIIADENNIFAVPYTGGTVVLDYQTNTQCKVIIPDEAKSWISIEPQTKALHSESVTLRVAENMEYNTRTAVIKVVVDGDKSIYAEYTINQDQRDCISASGTSISCGGWGQSVTIKYNTNVACELFIPEEYQSWISVSSTTKALEQKSATLNIAENNTGTERTGTIQVRMAGNNEIFEEYTITQNQRYIIEYTSTTNDVVTPSPFSNAFEAGIGKNTYKNGKGCIDFKGPITFIGYHAFKNCSSLKSITIPDSVTSIGEEAFYGCGSLTSLTIPDSVTSIGEEAFYGCGSLTGITIPHSVTKFGRQAFSGCTGELVVNCNISYITYYEYLDGYKYEEQESVFVNSNFTSVTIGDSVTTIGDFAFAGCSSLKSITIPDSVTTIGDYAFYDCRSLTSLTIPDSVTTIGRNAFYWCTGELVVNCNIPSASDYYLHAFYLSSFTSVTIGESVTTIGKYAFYGCSLKSITIPDSVTTIGRYAFYACSSLTSVTIPDSVTTIGDYAFCDCDRITSITIGDNVITIGDYAFSGCDRITSITIGDNVITIGDYAFSGCSSLTSVTIPDSVTTIGDYAFSGCSSLTSVTIGDSVTTIGDYAFYKCDSLYFVNIPDSVTTIGTRAFYDCNSLWSVYIGDGVTKIGDLAFASCSSLDRVFCEATTPPTLGDSAFAGPSALIFVPMESLSAYKSAKGWRYCELRGQNF